MRPNRVRARLEAGESRFGMFVFLSDPHVVGCTASVGFDFVCVCQEHGRVSFETLQTMVYAADAAGITPFARVCDVSWPSVLRALETGVQGILLPWCERPEQAEELVRQARYRPLGRRGAYGNAYPADYLRGDFRDYLEIANREVMLMVQIEFRAGLEAVEQIASVEGVDAVMIGPGDLSIQLDRPLDYEHPDMLAAMDRIVDATLAAGKHAALCHTTEAVLERYLERGVKLWWWGQDLNAMRVALLDDARRLRDHHGWTPNSGAQPGEPPLDS